MKHIVSISGGSGSAVAADRVLNRYQKEDVILWFSDTGWEDEDLYRFLIDLENRWKHDIIRHWDGRTPLDVAEQRQLIPNSMIAPCSHELKQIPFKKFLKTFEGAPVTVHLGMDWTEEHRHARPKATYEEFEGVTVDFPLTWNPLANIAYHTTIKSWGIEPPRLYSLGFPHNNCGGRCIRQGIKEWLRLKETFPDRFEEVKKWERSQRRKGGPRAKRAILKQSKNGVAKPITLAQLEKQERTAPVSVLDNLGDAGNCFCTF